MFRDKIMENGLKVRAGECYKIFVGYGIKCKPAIFATNSTNKRAWFDSTYDDDIWEINTEMIPDVKWYKDRHFESRSKHIVTFQDIPKEALTLKYKGTGSGDVETWGKDSPNLSESVRRILREELSPRVRRRVDPYEMEKEFLESFEFAYYLTKKRKVLSTHFLDELIYTTISMMMDGFHWRFTSTLPEDEFWYDDIHTELENHYRDRIIQMYNERRGINESILKEETEVPAFLRRRFSSEDLDWLVNDVKELIDYGESLDTAIYDGIREFVKSRKFADIDEFGVEADYWESYLRYERPLVDYVKKKLRIKDGDC
jgi:hypothetical protein